MGTNNPKGVEDLLVYLDKNADGRVTLQDFLETFPRLGGSLAEGTGPEMVHLSFDDEWKLSHVVMWVTGENTTTSTVKYGTSNDGLSQTFMGTTHTYTVGGWKGVIHEAHFPALPANTRFYYRVRCREERVILRFQGSLSFFLFLSFSLSFFLSLSFSFSLSFSLSLYMISHTNILPFPSLLFPLYRLVMSRVAGVPSSPLSHPLCRAPQVAGHLSLACLEIWVQQFP